MKSLDQNPFVWFLAVVAIGWWATGTGNFEFFAVFISAIILAKQIEILSK